MLFNSIQFLIFFPIVIFLYHIVPAKFKNICLLIASYIFYMSWSVKYVLLLLVSTFVTYITGIALERIKNLSSPEDDKTIKKRLVLLGCIIINLSMLFYFKYLGFSVSIISSLLTHLGVQISFPAVNIMLPIGISFYTFQAIGYTIDVYRNDIYAEKNFIKYALFVSFFPQLVAGPIERSKNLIKQLSEYRKFDFDLAREGLLLMLWGYFLKLIIADRIAIFVDTVYGDYLTYPGIYLIIATILFGIQIYCDFAGYSTIAMGAAKFLGINLMENFNAPYISSSTAEFWRKWHISLTSWFTDYLYIPLGGNRKGKIRKYINKLIVFLVSGMWHGASTSFAIWGGLNGLYQIIGEILMPVRNLIAQKLSIHKESFGYKFLSSIFTFILVDFSWVFFRADSTSHALKIIRSMMLIHNPGILFDLSLYNCGLSQREFILMILCILILFVQDMFKHYRISVKRMLLAQDWWFQIIVYVLFALFVIVFGIWGGQYDATGFIYFQF